MSTRIEERPAHGIDQGESLHEMRPWSEVGWIFKHGGALAIERRGDITRARAARISHRRDE